MKMGIKCKVKEEENPFDAIDECQFHLMDEYEEIVDKSFQGGYEKCKLDIQLNGYDLPDGYHFTDENGNAIDAAKILIKKNSPYPKDYEEDECCEVLGYKIDDVIFTNDTGWIRITKKLWDCYAKEHVYEGIGVINGHEYKDIRHNNVTGKMQLGHLNHCKDVDDVRYVNSITDDIMINQITNKVSVIKFKPDVCDNKIELQLGDYEIEVRGGKTYAIKKKPTYPKTYAECCGVIGYGGIIGFTGLAVEEEDLYRNFIALKRCRDAYWKIAGEELGLGKPWEPDWTNEKQPKYGLYSELKDTIINPATFAFPTEEMRDMFYDNFKELIEKCKEIL